jgi:hypothetical protein
MVCLKTRLENFDFWVWIKHPLFQEQALIPVVGLFPELKHTQFTWFSNLPTPRSYWFVLMKLTNNTNKEEENLLNSTLHSSSLYSSLFSLLSVFSLSATRRFFFSVISWYTYHTLHGGGTLIYN